MTRLAIDPVTRVNGQLRIEAELAGGAVADAWSSGTSYRGIEQVVHGRDPRDAWLLAERICGSCSGIHALASVRAVERAFGVVIPRNARLVRNLLTGGRFVQDHVAQFYRRALVDWVDLGAALRADPSAAAELAATMSPQRAPTTADLRAAQARLAAAASSAADGTGMLAGPWGHPAYRLSPEADLLLYAHSLEALDWQRAFWHLHVLLGGKDPHPQTFVVGGMALAPPWGGPAPALPREHPEQVDRKAPSALSANGLASIASMVAAARAFVDQVLVPDVMALAAAYPEWATIGGGGGDLLAFGEFPMDDSSEPTRFLPAGRILGGSLGKVEPVEQREIEESIAHAYYLPGAEGTDVQPSASPPEPSYAGPALPVTSLKGLDRYSWIKAPRYLGRPMETGPLARVLVAHVEGRVEVTARVDEMVGRLGIGPDRLLGTLGRQIARAIEAQVLVDRLAAWTAELKASLAEGDLALADLSMWDPGNWPAEASGWSLGEGPRGAVGHWVSVKGGAVDHYQVVDGSTWNASPRDGDGRRGPLEAALVGTAIADPERPLELLRVVHSFDPCTPCAAHLLDLEGTAAVEIGLRPGGGR